MPSFHLNIWADILHARFKNLAPNCFFEKNVLWLRLERDDFRRTVFPLFLQVNWSMKLMVKNYPDTTASLKPRRGCCQATTGRTWKLPSRPTLELVNHARPAERMTDLSLMSSLHFPSARSLTNEYTPICSDLYALPVPARTTSWPSRTRFPSTASWCHLKTKKQ